MRYFQTLIGICALLFSATAAQADDVYDKCINASSDNAAWAQCGGALIQREDAKLTTVWKRLFATTSGQTKLDLLAEQRAWIAFREASCKFYANGDYGREGQVLDYPACVAGVIADRTRALGQLAKDLAPK
jgi:uncharacterized protein YecT (DUF1311 family)